MSEVLDMQVYSLLGRMHELRDSGCRKLRAAAEEQAQEIIGDARHRARRRVKEAVAEKRRQVTEHCQRARVGVESRGRERHFAELGQRLAAGMAALPVALQERWARPGTRDAWCRQVLGGAAQVLRPGEWRLRVAPGLDARERTALVESAAALCGGAVELDEDDSMLAGLVVAHDGARYDGSVQGLLSDRNGVQAALLGELAARERKT